MGTWLSTILSCKQPFLTPHPNLTHLEVSCSIDIPVTQDCPDLSKAGDPAVQSQPVLSPWLQGLIWHQAAPEWTGTESHSAENMKSQSYVCSS